MKFTENLEELERILKKVENPNSTLESALEDFEKGIALIRECKSYLENAQQKVTTLMDENGGQQG